MKKRKFKISDILFVVIIALLIIPQTRTPIQVALNKLKVAVWSPSVENSRDQQSLMPFKYQLSDLNNESVIIPVGEGNITFLSYWATWCPPCLAEMPSIQELYKDYGQQIDFLLLTQEDPQVVQRFLDKKGYDLPVYFPQMNTPHLFRAKSVPTNFSIDAQGTILIKETGAADWNSEKVRKLIDELLAK